MAALLWFAVVAYAKVEKDVSKLQIGVKVRSLDATTRYAEHNLFNVDVHAIRPQACHAIDAARCPSNPRSSRAGGSSLDG